MTEAFKVSQADRFMAANHESDRTLREALVDGKADDFPLVQDFARHRHESQLLLLEALEEARRAIGNALELLRGTPLEPVATVTVAPSLAKIDKALATIRGEGS